MADSTFSTPSASPSAPAGPAVAGQKALPHNLSAELGVLGAIIYDNNLYWRVAEFLRPEDFYAPAHQRIYQKLQARISRSSAADPVVLMEAFEADGDLAEIGGPAYLARLIEKAAFGPEVYDYAKLIHDLSIRRGLVDIGAELTSRATKGEGELIGQGLIEETEKRLYSLAERDASGKGWVDFRNALAGALKSTEAAQNRDGQVSGIATGFKLLDLKVGGLHKSDLLILAGRPSMGKTALATNIAFNTARNCVRETLADGSRVTTHGAVVGFFSLEMSSEQLAARVLADAASVSSSKMRQGDLEKVEYIQMRDAAVLLERIPLYIDDTGGISISQLSARARRLQREKGLDLLIVDYLQLVTGSGTRKNDNRVNEVSEVTQGLKALAKELSIPVIALSQLSRQVEQREDKRPQLSDLRESGSIEQDADIVMFVYREEYYVERLKPGDPDESDEMGKKKFSDWQKRRDQVAGKAELIIAKQRHGPVGTIDLAFDSKYTRFGDLEIHHPDHQRE